LPTGSVRTAARRKDLAVRAALGGGWLRLMRERLLESALLSAFSGALGLGFAELALLWLVHTRQDIYRVESIHFDVTVAAFTLAIVALCALIRTDLCIQHEASKASSLRSMSRRGRLGGERGKTRLRRLLLSVESA
jgi:predicted lysophospholipase L1 biosynthesis ABC-type transport system permease subunit